MSFRLNGICLLYTSELGVEVIYFNPLFVSPSNHKYDIQDYDYIDPHFAVIKKDEGELLKEDEKENKKASRYICKMRINIIIILNIIFVRCV